MHIKSTNMQILVIEDNAGDFFLVEEFLIESFPYCNIDHVKTLEETGKKLYKGNQYDAILLDLTLPDSQGEDLVNSIIKLADSKPIIVLTGFTDKEFSVKTLALGISDYLIKDELSAPQLHKSISYSIERKRVNYKLQESEEKYRQLFNGNPMPMWVYELETLKFLNVNPAAERHYGYTKEEFLNLTLRDIRPPEDIEILERAVYDNPAPSDYNIGIYRHKNKAGKIFEVELQSNEIVFENKKARLVLAVDVSERMEYIRAIEEQNRIMHEIAWAQSHHVRAPLARMMGLINIIPSTDNKGELDKIIGYILNSAHELDSIVRDIVRKTERMDYKKK